MRPDELAQRGIVISAGQSNRSLTAGKQIFPEEKAEVLTAGWATASYLPVDDTGAGHQGKNG